MPPYQDPAAIRRRLQRELRRLRTEKGETQRDVAVVMDWSPSKVIRIESGAVGVSTNDLRQLLQHYAVAESDIENFVALNKEGRKQSFADFKVINASTRVYYGLEASAAIIRQYEPMIVPGLLQTEEYTKELLRGVVVPELSEEAVDELAEARGVRQQLLDRDPIPELFFIMDEAAIRREVGGKAVMRRQLERIEEIASRDRVSVQVIPFTKGAHPGQLGPLALLEFTDEDPVLFLEASGDQVVREDPDTIGRYLDLFQHMEYDLAAPAEELGKILSRAKKE